jgi:hypothetical protein
MSALAELQEWYLAQCNEDWEHTYGVSIGTLDNPGWSLEVDLSDSALDGATFEELSYGLNQDTKTHGQNWLVCRVKDNKFLGYGGPRKLDEMVNVFLTWAKQNA